MEQRGRGRTPGRGGLGRAGLGYTSYGGRSPPPPPSAGRGTGAPYNAVPYSYETSPGFGRGRGPRVDQHRGGGGRFRGSGRGSPGGSNPAGSGGRQRFSPGQYTSSGGSGYSPGRYTSSGGSGYGSQQGQLFGSGPEAVQYEKDKEHGIWKVGPPQGQRFSPAFLRGLSRFVEHRLQLQQPSVQQQQQQACPAAQPAALLGQVEHTHGAAAASVGTADDQEGAEEAMELSSEAEAGAGEDVAASEEEAKGDAGSRAVGSSQADGMEDDAVLLDSEGPEAAETAEAAAEDLVRRQASGLEASSSPTAAAAAAVEEMVVDSTSAEVASAVAGLSISLAGAEQQEQVAAQPAPLADGPPSPSITAAAGQQAELQIAAAGHGRRDGRQWWPHSPQGFEQAVRQAEARAPLARVASASEASALSSRHLPAAGAGRNRRGSGSSKVQLSLRLEHQGLTDPEAGMLADWCESRAGAVRVRKLWLFDNRLSDEGAVHVARIMSSHPGMLELHLSHNLLTAAGAAAVLSAVHVPAAEAAGAAAGAQEASPVPAASLAVPRAATPSLWLRIEWNRVSLGALCQELAQQHASRGLIADLPVALRAEAAPALPTDELPAYLAEAAARVAKVRAPAVLPGCRTARNSLQYLVEHCHIRLPWVTCQFQLPAEAEVLKAARNSWQQARRPKQQQPQQQQQESALAGAQPPPLPPPPAHLLPPGPVTDSVTAASAGTAGAIQAEVSTVAAGAQGPLLLVPDTSALLAMLGASSSVAVPTAFTLDMLGSLAQQGRMGRALPSHEQVFVVVPDAVMKQLDGLKNDPAARSAVRRFMSTGLDAWGPAGADFLTVLGAHEGEGLLLEHDAHVAGSGSTAVVTKGQRVDHKIVEVALFFQQELLRAAASSNSSSPTPASTAAADGPANPSGPGSSAASCNSLPSAAATLPMLLLSGDNAQIQLAKSHGLPAVRMAEVAAVQHELMRCVQQEGQALTASLLRQLWGPAAMKGLGSVAARSLQQEFDEAVAVLQAVVCELAAGRQQLASLQAALASLAPADVPGPLRQAATGLKAASSEPVVVEGQQPLDLAAIERRLEAWQALVRAHQDPSRVLSKLQG